jgi:AraC family transcriptional regulator of arabinose operon
MGSRIAGALEVVVRELDKPQALEHLAAQLRVSPSRFEHLFKQETGQGFKCFVRATRLAKANDLLQDRTLRIKEVAAAGGYGDVSHFVRDFKRQYGRSSSRSRSPSP